MVSNSAFLPCCHDYITECGRSADLFKSQEAPAGCLLQEILQANYFLLAQEAPLAAGQVLLGEAGVLHAVQGNHFVAEVLENAAHDAVAANVHFNAHEVRIARYYGHVVYLRFAIFQLHAFGNLAQVVFGQGLA